MNHQLSSKFCESLGMSVILCREDGEDRYRCLSSHLCGGNTCSDVTGQKQESASDSAAKA